MAKIHDIVENVYKRADNRGDSMKALLRKTDKEARAAINERRANTREQRKKEANDKLGKAVGIKGEFRSKQPKIDRRVCNFQVGTLKESPSKGVKVN